MTQNLHVVLSGLCAGLLLIIAAELLTEQNNSPARKVGARTSPPVGTTGPAPDTEAMVTAILGRPLFTPGRHPPSEEFLAPTAETPKEALWQLRGRLAGVTIRPGVREALFIREGQKPIAVNVGGEIDGWRISAIESDRVTLSSASGSQTIKPTNDPEAVHQPVHPIGIGIGVAPSAVSSAPAPGGNSPKLAAGATSHATPNPIVNPVQLKGRAGLRGPR